VFWLGVVVAGLVAPLLLAVAYERRWARRLVAWVGPTLVLVGGLALRYTIVVGGQLGGLS
jgi:formate-dependent nitrite reductase membrane component NrfD